MQTILFAAIVLASAACLVPGVFILVSSHRRVSGKRHLVSAFTFIQLRALAVNAGWAFTALTGVLFALQASDALSRPPSLGWSALAYSGAVAWLAAAARIAWSDAG